MEGKESGKDRAWAKCNGPPQQSGGGCTSSVVVGAMLGQQHQLCSVFRLEEHWWWQSLGLTQFHPNPAQAGLPMLLLIHQSMMGAEGTAAHTEIHIRKRPRDSFL